MMLAKVHARTLPAVTRKQVELMCDAMDLAAQTNDVYKAAKAKYAPGIEAKYGQTAA